MVCTTNITPTYLHTATIAQQSAYVVQMVSGFTSKLLLALNRRLKLFAFVNGLINDYDALVTTCRIHLGCYLFFQEMATAMGSVEKGTLMNKTKVHVSPNELDTYVAAKITAKNDNLYYTATCIFDRAYPGYALGPNLFFQYLRL